MFNIFDKFDLIDSKILYFPRISNMANKVFDAAGIVSEKKIKNEELAALVAGPLWKQEKAKKDKKWMRNGSDNK